MSDRAGNRSLYIPIFSSTVSRVFSSYGFTSCGIGGLHEFSATPTVLSTTSNTWNSIEERNINGIMIIVDGISIENGGVMIWRLSSTFFGTIERNRSLLRHGAETKSVWAQSSRKMDPGSGGGLLRTLGEDDGDGGLIGLPVRRAGTSGPPAGGAGGATAKGGANGKTPRGGSNSHVSISSDDDDEEEGKGSRYASLGKLGARPGHRGSGTSSPKPAGKTTASKDLNDYPSYPRGRVTATTASDGSSSEGASVPAKFAFKMLENQTKKKSRATAAKTMQAILIDSDDDEPAKSPKKTNEGSKLAAERAETPATKGTASNASAKKAGRALDTPSSARKHGKSPKSNDDFIPLGGSSDSDSGSMEAPEKVAPSKKKKTSYANSDSVAAAKPNPTSQKDSSLRDSGSPTRLLPLAGDFIPPTAPIPQKILVIPSLNPSLPEPVPPEPIRPVESASAASSVLSTSDANSIGRPKSAAERRKERRKRAKQRKLLADKDEEGEESDGAATPATSNAAEQSQQGSEEEDAIPGLGSMDKGKGPAQWLDSKPIAAVSGKNVAVIPPSEPKSRFSFTIGAQKTALSSVDLNKPLFRAAAEPPKPPSSTATEEEEADMEIESNAPSPGTSVSKDAYVDQDSMRARKKARTSAVEEDFISFADLLSDEEPEPKEPKRERYRPPPTARSGPEDERKRMFGDPSIFNPPLLNLPEPPWIPDGKQYLKNGGHPAAMLNAEVKDFIEYIQPRPNEHAMRQIVVERVTTAVRSVWPNATVEVFGSFDTKMYLPSSDIDLVVFEPTARPPMCLEPLARAMKDLGLVHSLEIISTARVPIIKSVDSLTLFRLDISFNMNSGLESAKIVKEMLESRVGGALRAMMFVLKQFLLQRNMNEVFSGGVGSYGLMIMIANFLMVGFFVLRWPWHGSGSPDAPIQTHSSIPSSNPESLNPWTLSEPSSWTFSNSTAKTSPNKPSASAWTSKTAATTSPNEAKVAGGAG